MSTPLLGSLSTDGPMNNGELDARQSVPEPTSQTKAAPPEKHTRGLLDNILVFVAVLCALGFIEGLSVNGLPNINISSIETRYELKSKEVGLIASSGEIGAICLLLFVSFYGGRSHRPRVTAGGGFIMGLGSLFFMLPHIFVGPYTVGDKSSTLVMCEASRPSYGCTSSEKSAKNDVSRFFPMFIVGQGLQGIGFTPAFTCGFAYIDDHSSSEDAALYIGIIYALTALGVGVGYVLGGQFLSFWVDIGRTDTSTVPISTSDKRWVGAWWIGYVLSTCLYFITATALCFFPRNIREDDDLSIVGEQTIELYKTEEEAEEVPSQSPVEEKKTLLELLLSFPKALLELICNPLYVLMVLVGTGDTLIVSGIAGFAPKIIEEKFDVEPSESGLIMGTVTLLGGAGGLGLGGYLIRRFHLKLLGILKMCLIFILVAAVVGGSCFFIHCPPSHFAGVTNVYGRSSSQGVAPSVVNLDAECNSNCSCTTRVFEPVCGEDGVTYFSACYAGCSMVNKNGTYENCTCIQAALRHSGKNGSGRAVEGSCSTPCSKMWFFSVILFLGILFTFLIVTPVSMAILRCVPERDRSVGLGLQWVMLRLLGTIPGPILTGSILDSTCHLWQDTCYGHGTCWMYDRQTMSLRLFLWWVIVKLFGVTVLSAAYLYYKKMGHAEVDRQEQKFDTSDTILATGLDRKLKQKPNCGPCAQKAPSVRFMPGVRASTDQIIKPRMSHRPSTRSLYYESRFDARASLYSLHVRRKSEVTDDFWQKVQPTFEVASSQDSKSKRRDSSAVDQTRTEYSEKDDRKQGGSEDDNRGKNTSAESEERTLPDGRKLVRSHSDGVDGGEVAAVAQPAKNTSGSKDKVKSEVSSNNDLDSAKSASGAPSTGLVSYNENASNNSDLYTTTSL